MKTKRLTRVFATSIAIICVVCAFSHTDVKAMENVNCKIIIGDSRTAGIIFALENDKNAVELYSNVNGASFESIFLKDNTLLLICAQSGGYYRDGACDRTFERAKKLMASQDILKNCASYSFYNLFGFNDVFLEPYNCVNAPGAYVTKDADFASRLGCLNAYQFNAGPVDEKGAILYGMTNATLAQYNQGFVSNSNVSVIDLYSYLCRQGYKASYSEADNSGIHYDEKTTNKIIGLIMSLY